jgi:acyl-CoA thioesterase YciA
VCRYVNTDLIRIGKTSIRAYVGAWVIRRGASKRVLVTDGNFTYVALDDERPRTIER